MRSTRTFLDCYTDFMREVGRLIIFIVSIKHPLIKTKFLDQTIFKKNLKNKNQNFKLNTTAIATSHLKIYRNKLQAEK